MTGSWRIESVAGEPATGDPAVSFEDGRVTGSTGVNRFTGSYELVDGVLRCSPLATTRMAGPPALVAQERALLAALAQPVAVEVDGARVVLGALVLGPLVLGGDPPPENA